MKNETFLLMLALFFILPFGSASKNKKSADVDFTLHIFSSSNITGNLEPCG